jgi:hypothetical protein
VVRTLPRFPMVFPTCLPPGPAWPLCTYLALPVLRALFLQSSPGPGSSLTAFLPLAACDDATLVPLATAALATPYPVEDHVAALKAVGSLLPVNAPVRASEHARCVVSCTGPHARRLGHGMDARVKTFCGDSLSALPYTV